MNAVPRIDVKDGYESVDTDPGQGLSDIFGAIRRRWKFLLTTVIVSLALAYALMALLTPRYTADARVLIEAEGRNLVSVEAVVPMLQADDTLVQSEAMVLSSRILATRVIQQLNLDEDPEFNPELRRSSTDESGAAAGDTSARAVDGFIESVLSIFGSEGQSTTQSSFVDLTDSIVIDRFLRRLRVLPIENSRVLSVTFGSEDPVKAAMIANLVVDEYIAFRVDAKLDTTRRAAGWVDEQVAELQALVAENEAAVERARQEYGLQETGGVTLASRELDSLDAQLFQARSQRTELRGRLSQVESLIESSADLDTAVEVLDSSLIQNLREQQAALAREVAELSTEFGERHPRMIQLRAEERDLQTNIGEEIDKIVGSLRNQVSISEARVATLTQELDGLKARVGEASQDEIYVRALEREAQSNRILLDNLLLRQKEILSQEDESFQQADARIISRAEIPLQPSFPLTMVVLGLVSLASGLLGFMMIMVLELIDRGFHSGEQLEQETGLPSLGVIPQVKGKQRSPVKTLLETPRSAYGESIRTLNWSIALARRDEPAPKVVMLASANSGEGKSTIATSLAMSQAAAGQRVMLMDGDTRWPSIQKLTDVSSGAGLTEVLRGETTLDKALRKHKKTGLDVLLAGASVSNPSSLFGSRRMADLIQALRPRYDLIVIDSPPIIACSDALVLTRWVDTTVLIVQFAKTRREVVKLCVKKLRTAGAVVAGGLLANVNLKRYSTYYYGDSGAYSGDLAKYYGG